MRPPRTASHERLERRSGPTLGGPLGRARRSVSENAVQECGWGRLVFAHTFKDADRVVEELRREGGGKRDIAFYVADPHVLLARAPLELFLDPSDTYRLWLSDYRPGRRRERGFVITPARLADDLEAINRIYLSHRMMPLDGEALASEAIPRRLLLLAARDETSDNVIGVVMGVDHVQAFNDSEGGSSLWSLAVDPQSRHPGIGEALTRRLTERFMVRKRVFMDLSVMHDNEEAIALYRKLGFQRVPVFAVKTRNPINEQLYTGPVPAGEERLNVYAEIIVNEARRRGIKVEILDAEHGYFRLEFGGRSIRCRESLSELTTAVAMSLCDNKEASTRALARAGLRVPDQRRAGTDPDNAAFLARHGEVVVKPARGEQGQGVTVGVTTPEELARAIETARRFCEVVLLEECIAGEDLRLVVIGDEVVAAAVRRPPEVVGNGRDTIARLIERQSRRRQAASRGESRIPMDHQTEACVAAARHALDDVLPEGETLVVRRAANLHAGGTITDVTAELNPALAEAALAAARAIDIPVTGIDMLVPSVTGSDYVIIEVNERPGLANHEPRPTVERFIDLLFPQSVSRPRARRQHHGRARS